MDRDQIASSSPLELRDPEWNTLTDRAGCCEASHNLQAALTALRAEVQAPRPATLAAVRLAIFALAGVHDLAKTPGFGRLSAALGPLDRADLVRLGITPDQVGLVAGSAR